jgi:hypothetical protein
MFRRLVSVSVLKWNLGPIDRASGLSAGTNKIKTGTSSIYLVQLSRFHLKTETESSLRNVLLYVR